jgi:tetratricopeptide (TPR) repeat protein
MLAWGTPLFFPSENIRKKILFPSAIVILSVLAILTWKQCGHWKSSISLFNHTLHVTKNNDQTNYILGLDYTEIALHKYQSVIQDNNKGLPSKSDDALTCYNRALTYAKHGQYQRAIADYNKAIRLKPDYIEAYNNRGNIYGQYGLYPLAIEDFNKVIAINPHHIKVYNNRGRAYSEMGQYQKAIEDFNRAIHLKPDYTGAYINRANAFLRKGNRAAGCQDAHMACELGDCKTLDFMRAKGLCR